MASQTGLLRQAAVIPLKEGQVCLVTSRSGKRWVVPKGTIDPGKSTGEIALQEAWEEAGLVGILEHQPLGSYVYHKDGMICHVIVFLMHVTSIVDQFPEYGMRQRIWLQLPLALKRVEDAGLRDILEAVALSRAS